MQAMGWEDGRNIRFLFVFTEGSNEHAPELIGWPADLGRSQDSGAVGRISDSQGASTRFNLQAKLIFAHRLIGTGFRPNPQGSLIDPGTQIKDRSRILNLMLESRVS
jgi:hypothetical protein